MSVGFVVLAHSDPKLLGALLQELAPYPTFLHVDRPGLSEDYLIDSGIVSMPEVVLNEQPRCLHWGGYSILQAMLETLDLALRKTGPDTSHFAFLSGQCFPLRPVSEFVQYVERMEASVFCRAVRLDGDNEMGIQRVTRRHWLDGVVGHAKKTGPSKIMGAVRRILVWSTAWSSVVAPDIEHACGSQWSCLPRELAQEVVDHYSGGGFNYLNNAYAPDEVAIPSFIYNSHWRSKTQTTALESASGEDVSAFTNFHWLRANLQGTVDARDVELALSSGNFFIRKIAASNYGEIIRIIKSRW